MIIELKKLNINVKVYGVSILLFEDLASCMSIFLGFLRIVSKLDHWQIGFRPFRYL